MRTIRTSLIAIAAFLVVVGVAQAGRVNDGPQVYRKVVDLTAAMVYNTRAQELVRRAGLNLLNLTWEDTGRYKQSCVGPNISDMTIQVQQHDPRTNTFHLTCMPVIRYANYSDRSADITPDDFYLLVGNERGKTLHRVTLTQYLEHFRSYLSNPDSWKGTQTSLLAPRDTHVLVSAQACFLPVPLKGKAQFNVVLFNYQSSRDNPAVLTILATREGTSATVIDNVRDPFEAGATWGQRLFFNMHGRRASLTGERVSDFLAHVDNAHSRNSHAAAKAAGTGGLNMVMLIQVPLKHRVQPVRWMTEGNASPYGTCKVACSAPRRSDVEDAVVGHGKQEGAFTEIGGLPIERDPNFPVRVTVQFYLATSNGVISHANVAAIAQQIKRVYSDADYVGSLVTDGNTRRPTEYNGAHSQPPGWWNDFWKRYENNTGLTRRAAQDMLRRLLGPAWHTLPVDQIIDTLNRHRPRGTPATSPSR